MFNPAMQEIADKTLARIVDVGLRGMIAIVIP
jgi:hypothetical protein